MADPTSSGSRQLWILRHAEAADVPPGGHDRDRPLTGRGRRDATRLGARLAVDGQPLDERALIRPDLVLCSAARRTVQTAELILGQLVERVPLDSYVSLYEAEPDTVLTYLHEVEETVRSVLVIGHFPTVYHLSWDLLADGSPDRDLLADRGFPPCALTVVELGGGGWEAVSGGQGSLLGLFAPPW